MGGKGFLHNLDKDYKVILTFFYFQTSEMSEFEWRDIGNYDVQIRSMNTSGAIFICLTLKIQLLSSLKSKFNV